MNSRPHRDDRADELDAERRPVPAAQPSDAMTEADVANGEGDPHDTDDG